MLVDGGNEGGDALGGGGAEPALSLRGIEKAFGHVRAIRGVDLDIPRGELFGLLGPNGAGKTTLIRIALDILRPDVGVVLFDGHRLRREDLSRIGYLPEERGLYRKRRIVDVMRYLAELKGLDVASAREAADRWLARLGMADVAKQKVETLSKGNQQKVQLAGTLVADPDLIVWDEPFSGLDPVNAREVRSLLRELRAGGTTIVLSTHQMSAAEELCDRVGLVAGGRLVLCDAVSELREQHGGASLEEVFVRAVEGGA